MTGRTIGAHGPFMWFVFAVAIHTVPWGIAVFFVRCMAIGALRFFVRVQQLEIGERVVETALVQNNDLRIPAFMFRVTRFALIDTCFGMKTVEPDGRNDVCCDILVTVHAQLTLFGSVKLLVTRGALRLEICVPKNDIAGHDQALNILGGRFGNCEKGSHHHSNRYIFSPTHVSRSFRLVHMHREHMHRRRNNEYQKNGHVKYVPHRKQSFIKGQLGNLSH